MIGGIVAFLPSPSFIYGEKRHLPFCYITRARVYTTPPPRNTTHIPPSRTARQPVRGQTLCAAALLAALCALDLRADAARAALARPMSAGDAVASASRAPDRAELSRRQGGGLSPGSTGARYRRAIPPSRNNREKRVENE